MLRNKQRLQIELLDKALLTLGLEQTPFEYLEAALIERIAQLYQYEEVLSRLMRYLNADTTDYLETFLVESIEYRNSGMFVTFEAYDRYDEIEELLKRTYGYYPDAAELEKLLLQVKEQSIYRDTETQVGEALVDESYRLRYYIYQLKHRINDKAHEKLNDLKCAALTAEIERLKTENLQFAYEFTKMLNIRYETQQALKEYDYLRYLFTASLGEEFSYENAVTSFAQFANIKKGTSANDLCVYDTVGSYWHGLIGKIAEAVGILPYYHDFEEQVLAWLDLNLYMQNSGMFIRTDYFQLLYSYKMQCYQNVQVDLAALRRGVDEISLMTEVLDYYLYFLQYHMDRADECAKNGRDSYLRLVAALESQQAGAFQKEYMSLSLISENGYLRERITQLQNTGSNASQQNELASMQDSTAVLIQNLFDREREYQRLYEDNERHLAADYQLYEQISILTMRGQRMMEAIAVLENARNEKIWALEECDNILCYLRRYFDTLAANALETRDKLRQLAYYTSSICNVVGVSTLKECVGKVRDLERQVDIVQRELQQRDAEQQKQLAAIASLCATLKIERSCSLGEIAYACELKSKIDAEACEKLQQMLQTQLLYCQNGMRALEDEISRMQLWNAYVELRYDVLVASKDAELQSFHSKCRTDMASGGTIMQCEDHIAGLYRERDALLYRLAEQELRALENDDARLCMSSKLHEAQGSAKAAQDLLSAKQAECASLQGKIGALHAEQVKQQRNNGLTTKRIGKLAADAQKQRTDIKYMRLHIADLRYCLRNHEIIYVLGAAGKAADQMAVTWREAYTVQAHALERAQQAEALLYYKELLIEHLNAKIQEIANKKYRAEQHVKHSRRSLESAQAQIRAQSKEYEMLLVQSSYMKNQIYQLELYNTLYLQQQTMQFIENYKPNEQNTQYFLAAITRLEYLAAKLQNLEFTIQYVESALGEYNSAETDAKYQTLIYARADLENQLYQFHAVVIRQNNVIENLQEMVNQQSQYLSENEVLYASLCASARSYHLELQDGAEQTLRCSQFAAETVHLKYYLQEAEATACKARDTIMRYESEFMRQREDFNQLRNGIVMLKYFILMCYGIFTASECQQELLQNLLTKLVADQNHFYTEVSRFVYKTSGYLGTMQIEAQRYAHERQVWEAQREYCTTRMYAIYTHYLSISERIISAEREKQRLEASWKARMQALRIKLTQHSNVSAQLAPLLGIRACEIQAIEACAVQYCESLNQENTQLICAIAQYEADFCAAERVLRLSMQIVENDNAYHYALFSKLYGHVYSHLAYRCEQNALYRDIESVSYRFYRFIALKCDFSTVLPEIAVPTIYSLVSRLEVLSGRVDKINAKITGFSGVWTVDLDASSNSLRSANIMLQIYVDGMQQALSSLNAELAELKVKKHALESIIVY